MARIAVVRESAPDERRVAATPETVRKFIGLGAEVAVESGAGIGASIDDAAYTEAGALVGDRSSVVDGADLILAVQAPEPASIAGAKPSAFPRNLRLACTSIGRSAARMPSRTVRRN